MAAASERTTGLYETELPADAGGWLPLRGKSGHARAVDRVAASGATQQRPHASTGVEPDDRFRAAGVRGRAPALPWREPSVCRSPRACFGERLSENSRGPTTSWTSMTRSRFCAGPFRSRDLRFGRLPRSWEVPPKRRCHFRTTARNSLTASRLRNRSVWERPDHESDRRRRPGFRALRERCPVMLRCSSPHESGA